MLNIFPKQVTSLFLIARMIPRCYTLLVLLVLAAGTAEAQNRLRYKSVERQNHRGKFPRKRQLSLGSQCTEDGPACGTGLECDCGGGGRRLFGAPAESTPTCTCESAPSPPPLPLPPPAAPPPAAPAVCNSATWSDVQNYCVSDGTNGGNLCMVVFKTFQGTAYHDSCNNYCQAQGHACVDGWEDSGDSCTMQGGSLGCAYLHKTTGGTHDAVCECSPQPYG